MKNVLEYLQPELREYTKILSPEGIEDAYLDF